LLRRVSLMAGAGAGRYALIAVDFAGYTGGRHGGRPLRLDFT